MYVCMYVCMYVYTYEPVMPTKMCLNQTYIIVCVRKMLSEIFPIQNHLTKGGAL